MMRDWTSPSHESGTGHREFMATMFMAVGALVFIAAVLFALGVITFPG